MDYNRDSMATIDIHNTPTPVEAAAAAASCSGSYGATDNTSPRTAGNCNDGSSSHNKFSTETTPLIAPDQEFVQSPQGLCKLPPTPPVLESSQSPPDDATGDSELDLDANALRSGVKKVKMYHQSDVLNHDIMGVRKRLGLLLPFLWPSGELMLQLRILGCFLILAVGRLVNVLVPLQYKIVVDGLTPKDGSPVKFEWGHVLFYAVLRSMQGSVGILTTIQSFVWIPVGQATTKRISVAMFEHLHKLSLRFHVGRKTGEILRVQDRGVTSVASLFSSCLFNIIPTIIDIVFACYFFSVMFDLYFGTIVLTTMSSYLAVTILLTGWRTRYRRLSNYLDNEMEARAVDSLLNFETVKFYNAEEFECREYTQTVKEYQDAEWKSNASMNLINSGQNLIIQLGLLAGALLSAKRVSDGEMTVGDFTMLLAYISQLYAPLNWFGTYYRVIQKNFIDMEKLLEMLDEPVEVEDLSAPQPLDVPNGEVVFDNVSFSYDEQPTLRNISFKVPAGSTVAIVGPSGSGKSTILRLLLRFYDVQAGRILIDGQDIRSVSQDDLRQAIGVVPQDTVLFNDSIRYNIAYGKAGSNSSVSMREVVAAADAAHIHSRIMGFPEQYETRVGERGQRLSGGEKQRVAIARTLLKNPKIVCLDEATSALDTATERNIQSSLREMTRNRTTLIIAHRLSTVIHADLILIVQAGRIVERGTHAELISNSESLYYDMWMKQLADATNTIYSPLLEQPDIGIHSPAVQKSESQQIAQPTQSGPAHAHAHAHAQTGASPTANSEHQGSMHTAGVQTVDNIDRDRRNSIASIASICISNDSSAMAKRTKEHLRLALDQLPRIVLSQGWMAQGPLTAPLPMSVSEAFAPGNGLFVNTTSSPAETTLTTPSSSFSALDPNILAMNQNTHAYTAMFPAEGDTTAGPPLTRFQTLSRRGSDSFELLESDDGGQSSKK
ncbi:ATP-binding cassette-type vacuolar membrane transporter Hmt1 [Dipsacomyces acuminosporus]|nr:ATP-binding cassette-type vacuolar membrane transporter Hmt1 [Dipsacomyces acuminosporus]